jgi:hypothetical protein
MLAILFLAAIWLDRTQPAQAPAATYTVLSFYVILAIALAIVSWSSWWFDARLARHAHLVDIAVFTLVVFTTDGYTSPFFLFFVFILLASAIRWGWRETALTAIALIALYLLAGLIAAVGIDGDFEIQRFVIRSGHLIILSAILIWFGVNQRFAHLPHSIDLPFRSQGRLETEALALAMRSSAARFGVLLLRNPGGHSFSGFKMTDSGKPTAVSFDQPPVRDIAFATTFLFDLQNDRALTIRSRGRARFGRASVIFDQTIAAALPFTEGLACAVRGGAAEGWLLLGGIPSMSADHVQLGRGLGNVVAVFIDRQALLRAMGDGAPLSQWQSPAGDLEAG